MFMIKRGNNGHPNNSFNYSHYHKQEHIIMFPKNQKCIHIFAAKYTDELIKRNKKEKGKENVVT